MIANQHHRRVITFYSYKGGCGRTMALANVAWRLAFNHGLHVIAVDWDLEAPGLHRYFGYSDADLADKPGVLDYMLDWNSRHQRGDTSVPDAVLWLLPPRSLPAIESGSLLFLPAGQLDHRYSTRLAELNWPNFYEASGGGGAVEMLRHKLREEADLVLCDSRTGLADVASVGLVHLPDGVVLMGSPNEQSVDGIARAARTIARPGIPRGGRGRPQVWVSIARVPIVEETTLSRLWLEQHGDWFEAGITDGLWSRTEHPNGIQSYVIPQRGAWALGEPIVRDDRADPDEPLLAAFKKLTKVIHEWAHEEQVSLLPAGPTASADEARNRATDAERRDDATGLGIALFDWARALYNAGEIDDAFARMQRAAGIHFALGMKAQYGKDLRWLGNLRRSQGFLDEALDDAQQALKISREVSNKEDEAGALHVIGNVYFSKRRFDDALHYHQQALEILGQLGNRNRPLVKISMALAHFEKQQFDAAKDDLHDASADLPSEMLRERGVVLGIQGDIARENKNFETAVELYEEAIALFEKAGDRRSRGEALIRMGMLRRREGALDRAIRYFERALDAVTTPGWDKRYSGIALREKGCALREQTKTVDAIEAFNQSLLALDKPSDSFEVALTLREKGITLRAQGGLDEALQILENARSRFESYDERREVEATVRELVEVRKAKARMDAS